MEGPIDDVLYAVGTGLGSDRESVQTCLRPTCHFVRSLCNLAGHPTGQAIPATTAPPHILLLPAFLRRVRSLQLTLKGLP